jgi:hypothetical protein
MLLMLGLISGIARPKLVSERRWTRIMLLPGSAIIQMLALAWAESQRHVDPVGYRFLAPITLLLLMTGILLAAEFLEREAAPPIYRAWGWLLPLPLLAVPLPSFLPQYHIFGAWLVLIAAEGIARIGPAWRHRAVGWLVLVSMLGFHLQAWQTPRPAPRQSRHGNIAAWLRTYAPPGSVYAGSRAARDVLLEAPEYLQLMGVSATQDNPEVWVTAEELERLQRRYGLRYLIFPGPPSPEGAARYGPFLAELMAAPDLPATKGRVITRKGFRIVELAPPPPE